MTPNESLDRASERTRTDGRNRADRTIDAAARSLIPDGWGSVEGGGSDYETQSRRILANRRGFSSFIVDLANLCAEARVIGVKPATVDKLEAALAIIQRDAQETIAADQDASSPRCPCCGRRGVNCQRDQDDD
jgi:hypothetical protein